MKLGAHRAKPASSVVHFRHNRDRLGRLRRRWADVYRKPPPETDVAKAKAVAPLIAEDLRSHHFGAVISRTGKKLRHAYRLANTTATDVKIVNLVNLKPCCGDVCIAKNVLRPGDVTEVEVTLSIKQEFGDIVHGTRVVTEPPQPDDLMLLTMANAYPPIRIEEVTSASGAVLLSSDEPDRVELRVFAYGSATEPLADLGGLAVRSTIKAGWAGTKEALDRSDGLVVESSRLTAALDAIGPPGERKAEIELLNGRQTVHSHVVAWRVFSRITPEPKVIVIQPGKREHQVSLRSRDNRPFRVTQVESDLQGLRCRAQNGAAALVQAIEIECEPGVRPSGGRGRVTVGTDHPLQSLVALPLVVID